MANSLLLHEGTGIAFERRQEISDDVHTRYVDSLPEGELEQYGFTSAFSFDNIVLDFDARIVPEHFSDVDVHCQEYSSFLNLADRREFLRGVAGAIVLTASEVEICAELLGVRPVLLQAATKLKPARPVNLMPYGSQREHNLALLRQFTHNISA